MRNRSPRQTLGLVILVSLTAGCHSPYRSDQGALFGGATGAGVGALVGDAVGNAGAGAAIGAGVGALTGAAVGQSLDEIEAANRAEIEARLGRPVAPGAATIDEVISMTKAAVEDEVIVNYIRGRGVAVPLDASDLIHLKQEGVSGRVIQAMQSPPPVAVQSAAPYPPPRVIVEEHYVEPPFWGPHYHYRHHHHWRPRSGVSWGVEFGR